MSRDEKIDLIAAMFMVRHNGKCRAEDALVCAESVLCEIELLRIEKEIFSEDAESVPLCLARPITFKPQ
jgi:hypothetical protein